MKKSSLFILQLLLLSSIVSFAQRGNLDTTRCYGLTELRNIAATAQNLETCDTLLNTAKAKIKLKDETIEEKNYQIDQHLLTINIKDKLLKIKEDTIASHKTTITKYKRANKALKLGWITTSVFFVGLCVFLMIR